MINVIDAAPQIADIKSLLRFSFEILLHHDEGYTLAMSNIYSYISKINFDSEYTDFTLSHDRCNSLKPCNYLVIYVF